MELRVVYMCSARAAVLDELDRVSGSLHPFCVWGAMCAFRGPV